MDFGTNLVLVTGALGWLGISLLKALVNGLADCESLSQPQANLQIRCLILPGQDGSVLNQLSERIEVVTGDLHNPRDCDLFCDGAEGAILFHTAGIIHPKRVPEFYQVNVEGTKNLLDAAIHSGVKRAVVVSSNSPFGCNPHPDHLFDENSPYNPYMNYGRSKMLMELAVKERYQTGKIETVIIRAPWFYGPNQPPRQTLFFSMIRDGKGPIVGDGNNLRSMVYIDNLCQGLLLAALVAQANGQIYWIADERPYSMHEIIDTVEDLLESEFNQKCVHKRLKLPGFASEVALLIDASLQAIGIYHQKIHVLSEMNKTIACSTLKAQRELGYVPKVALEEGMRRSLKWVVEQQGGIHT
jgi:nucleoside-diphosphate-sugar epimerase